MTKVSGLKAKINLKTLVPVAFKENNMTKCIKVIAAAMIAAAGVLLTSCYEPSPLYGKWESNDGSSITFVSGSDEFNAVIMTKDSTNTDVKNTYSGTYSYVENTLTLTYKNNDDAKASNGDSGTMNTEWDVRGSILYITWTSKLLEGEGLQTVVLTLYHTAK